MIRQQCKMCGLSVWRFMVAELPEWMVVLNAQDFRCLLYKKNLYNWTMWNINYTFFHFANLQIHAGSRDEAAHAQVGRCGNGEGALKFRVQNFIIGLAFWSVMVLM